MITSFAFLMIFFALSLSPYQKPASFITIFILTLLELQFSIHLSPSPLHSLDSHKAQEMKNIAES
jgi:hypothetical protein